MNKSFEYTCLFGGGAIRGISYIGAVKAMEELGVTPSILGGSSVGSIIAALLAVGYNAEEIKHLFMNVNFDLFRDISFGFGSAFALSKGEVFLEWVRDMIEAKFYGKNYKKGSNRAVTFKDINTNLIIITTNLSNFECKEFSKFETPDYEIASAVRISCCMPGLMKPIEYNKTLLVDGDLQKSWPMWKLSQNLSEKSNRILEFRLEGDYNKSYISGIDYANAVYSCMTAMSTSFIVDTYAQKDEYDYIVLNTGDIVVVDFNMNENKRNELIQLGYEQTMNYFKKVLPQKKHKLKKDYETLHAHIGQIIKFLNCGKPVKAKIQLGDLFTELCDLKDFVNLNDFEDIKKFKDIFIQNLKFPALFGRIKLKNENLIKAEITKIDKNIQDRISEYKEYLKKFPLQLTSH